MSVTIQSAAPVSAPTASVASPTPAAPTPRLELSVGTALARYLALASALPGTAVHYAVKANPHPVLLRALAQAGCRFDVASPAEVRVALEAGAAASDLVHSNPVARRDHLAEAHALGVRLFVVDSPGEVAKLSHAAPGASVLVRIVTSGSGSDWPLSRKYGCTVDEAVALLVESGRRGLDPAGVSFHVGSQQRNPHAWAAPIASAARVFAGVGAAGHHPWLLDLGGGFPARLDGEPIPIADYGQAIDAHLTTAFGADRPRTLVEPGRGVVGDAGTVVTSVVGVVDRGGARWVFVDAGVFTGLVETLDEAIRYRLEAPGVGGPTGPCVLAGPTCDSADVLYETTPVWLPLALAEGDELRIHAAGAYSTCYSTVGFNGFAPLPTVITR
ncbi:MAG TPA: type III PLP-dependent enzyme [Ornithinibacter sp.]|nr:type III PLP-dependent enzyme [Ornithinibacter sp.]